MNNTWTITKREYLTRVKKKSFILMTLLTPLLIAAFYGVIIWVSMSQSTSTEELNLVIVDPTNIFEAEIEEPDDINFLFETQFTTLDLAQNDSLDGLITVPSNFEIADKLDIKYESEGSLSVNNKSRIERAFKEVLREKKLKQVGVSQSTIDSLYTSVSINQFKVEEDGTTKKSNIGINTLLGMAFAFMIYMFIFLYGVQVMKGVIEEKTNRIVELIISTVKPFQLMMGKVIGIALVGLTQLLIWVLLTSVLTGVIGAIVGLNMTDMDALQTASNDPALQNLNAGVLENVTALLNLPLAKIFAVFLFFFLAGYLFYGALFAAIGSAVDSETDTQQFMLPITLPLVFSFAISFSIVVGDPNGTLATWMSIVPISSPIVMMVRMPFDPPTWQILLSTGVMILSIIGVIWLAGRIYRTGILMYGKKPTYKELAKWLFYKN
jgi:ABC-2 type transport system permease protein